VVLYSSTDANERYFSNCGSISACLLQELKKVTKATAINAK